MLTKKVPRISWYFSLSALTSKFNTANMWSKIMTKIIITVIIIKYSEFCANLSYCIHPYQLPYLWDRWGKIEGTENTGFPWDPHISELVITILQMRDQDSFKCFFKAHTTSRFRSWKFKHIHDLITCVLSSKLCCLPNNSFMWS